ncbi:MAG: hypothetical protein ACRYGG_22745 [Janthinobacterium lividum]
MTIPHICLFSPEDGTPEARKEYTEALESNGQSVLVETFEGMIHGWMAARADLKDEKVRAEFERGYQLVADFYGKYL